MTDTGRPIRNFEWKKVSKDSGDIPLAVSMVREQRALVSPHTHDFEELLLVVSGTGSYTTPSHVYQLEPGDIFLLHPGQMHEFSNQHHLVIYNVMWTPEIPPFDVDGLSRMPGYHLFFHLEPKSRERMHFKQHLHLNEEHLAHAKTLIEQIYGELYHPGEGSRTAVSSLLNLLFVMICRWCMKPDDARRNDLQKMAEVIHYMETHSAEALSRSHLARIANMSEATFFRHFRRTTGMPPMEYLQNLRLDRAEILLRTTSLALFEISQRCGFCDGNYFIACFRKRFNITPHRYRKLFR